MQILYGVQATGNGHISRSREVVAALKRAGHTVHVILSGRDPARLWDMEVFEPYTTFAGMTFNVRSGRVRYLPTLLQQRPLQLRRDITGFDARGYDVAIVDFEPVTARIARRHSIPSIGLGHQYAFAYPVPVARRDPLARLVMRCFAPVTYPLGLHWYHFNCPILPPIIPPQLSPASITQQDKIVVYLPFEQPAEVCRLLRGFTDYRFHFYTTVQDEVCDGPIRCLPFSRSGFLADMRDCGGIVANAGFALGSEALHLGKKLLVRPLAGQLEQLSNALALEQLGLGAVMRSLDTTALAHWLSLPQQQPIRYPDVAAAVSDWITRGNWHDTRSLRDSVWAPVDMSEPARAWQHAAATFRECEN